MKQITPSVKENKVLIRAGLFLLIFATYAMRTSTLTLQSMWIDEVMALEFTEGTFAETVQTIIQPHHNGPLFYLLLFGWRHLVGTSDFAVRYLSLTFSILTLPLLYQWGRRLLNARSAALATWLLAFSPFTLWFAQEAKMYSLHIFVTVASSLALWDAFHKGKWWRWLLYAALTSTVFYSHLFGAFFVASQAGMALVLGWTRRKKRLLTYGITMGLLAAVHVPLLSYGLKVIGNYQPQELWRHFMPLGALIRDLIGRFYYRVPHEDLSWARFVLPAGLIAVGVVAAAWRKRRRGVILLLTALGPLAIFYPLSHQVPVYSAKYLSAMLPGLFILAAWGIDSLVRAWRLLGALALALGIAMMGGIVRDWTNPAVQRGDWRYVADYVETHEGANDVVTVYADYAAHAFERYFDGTAHVEGFIGHDPYNPAPYFADQEKVYDHLWLVLYHDRSAAPENLLQATAENAYPMMTGQFPNGGEIALFGYQLRLTHPSLPEEAQPLDVCFENGLCLVGYRLEETKLPATDPAPDPHPPSNWIHIVLYWQKDVAFEGDSMRPLVRLIDEAFQVWGGEISGRKRNLFRRFPPEEWPVGEIVESHFDVNLNPTTPPGQYRLEISLAEEGDENRRILLAKPLADGLTDRFVFETIQIVPTK